MPPVAPTSSRAVESRETLADPAARSAALDLNKEISDPGVLKCSRWPENKRLVSSFGEVVKGRCKSPNQCVYCAKLAAIENAVMLTLDAAENAPTMWFVLTTRSTDPDPRAFYRSREQLFKALRRCWANAEWACLLEFTTGYGPRSGGKRRPHFNVLLKNVPASAVDEVRAIVERVWCAREDALPSGQYVDLVNDAEGVMRYLALHFQKESQRPPAGWRGHRFIKSRGYFPEGAAVAREAARAAIRERREFRKAALQGLTGEAAEAVVQAALAIAEMTSWKLKHLSVRELAGELQRPFGEVELGS